MLFLHFFTVTAVTFSCYKFSPRNRCIIDVTRVWYIKCYKNVSTRVSAPGVIWSLGAAGAEVKKSSLKSVNKGRNAYNMNVGGIGCPPDADKKKEIMHELFEELQYQAIYFRGNS